MSGTNEVFFHIPEGQGNPENRYEMSIPQFFASLLFNIYGAIGLGSSGFQSLIGSEPGAVFCVLEGGNLFETIVINSYAAPSKEYYERFKSMWERQEYITDFRAFLLKKIALKFLDDGSDMMILVQSERMFCIAPNLSYCMMRTILNHIMKM